MPLCGHKQITWVTPTTSVRHVSAHARLLGKDVAIPATAMTADGHTADYIFVLHLITGSCLLTACEQVAS